MTGMTSGIIRANLDLSIRPQDDLFGYTNGTWFAQTEIPADRGRYGTFDHLREQAARHGFAFTIFRPQLVFGDVTGVAMNLMPVIGAYAAVCRELGLPFAYPGGPSNILEATDARVLANALRSWLCSRKTTASSRTCWCRSPSLHCCNEGERHGSRFRRLERSLLENAS